MKKETKIVLSSFEPEPGQNVLHYAAVGTQTIILGDIHFQQSCVISHRGFSTATAFCEAQSSRATWMRRCKGQISWFKPFHQLNAAQITTVIKCFYFTHFKKAKGKKIKNLSAITKKIVLFSHQEEEQGSNGTDQTWAQRMLLKGRLKWSRKDKSEHQRGRDDVQSLVKFCQDLFYIWATH